MPAPKKQTINQSLAGRVVLGIDPGLGTVGFGCLRLGGTQPEMVDAGTIETPPGLAVGQRLGLIKADLEGLIAELKPDLIGVEKLFFSKNVTTGIDVAGARGVILMVAAASGAEIVELTPNQIKLSLTGWGAAPKSQMRVSIKQHLKINPKSLPDDCADALATALAAAQAQGLETAKIGASLASGPEAAQKRTAKTQARSLLKNELPV